MTLSYRLLRTSPFIPFNKVWGMAAGLQGHWCLVTGIVSPLVSLTLHPSHQMHGRNLRAVQDNAMHA